MRRIAKSIAESFVRIYRQPKYIILSIFIAVVYYCVLTFLIRYQNYGILLVTLPTYLIYLLIATSAVLLTLSVYSFRNTRKNMAEVSASSVGTVAVLVGGLIGGCGCAEPLVLGLSVLGLSISTTTALDYVLTIYSTAIFCIMIIANAAVILYYLNKFSKPSCRIKPKNG